MNANPEQEPELQRRCWPLAPLSAAQCRWRRCQRPRQCPQGAARREELAAPKMSHIESRWVLVLGLKGFVFFGSADSQQHQQRSARKGKPE